MQDSHLRFFKKKNFKACTRKETQRVLVKNTEWTTGALFKGKLYGSFLIFNKVNNYSVKLDYEEFVQSQMY